MPSRGIRNESQDAPTPPLKPAASPSTGHEQRGAVQAQDVRPVEGRVLYQDSFFVCTVKAIGDIPGACSIYVELVVDRDSGIAFAKLYPFRNPANAVDVLTSRVLPYFNRHGADIGEIHTRNRSAYRGLVPRHPFQTFLATSQVQHVTITASDPHYYLCEEFYWFLRKEFFPMALRAKFKVSLVKLQRDLDNFLDVYNSGRRVDAHGTGPVYRPMHNFVVDL